MTEEAPARTESPVRLRGWGFIFMGTAFATFAAGSVLLLLPPLLQDRGMSEGQIGLTLAVGAVASLLVRIPAGFLYQRSSAISVIVGGGALMVVALLLLASLEGSATAAMLIAINGAAFAVVSTIGMAAVVEHRPPTVSLGSLMAWFTGSIGAGYSLAAFAAGVAGDAVGLRPAIRLASMLPIAAIALLAIGLRRISPTGVDPGPSAKAERPPFWHGIRIMPAGLWTAFLVGMYINLVNGALHAFFPLYGLTLGLTLTQIGLIGGVHSTLASIVRFGVDPLLAHTSYRRVITILVLVTAVAVAALALPSGVILLGSIFALIGLARGILRVASGALAVEGSTEHTHGSASGIYLSGLDLGNVVGPLIGGAAAELVGLRAAFPVIGLTVGALYAVITAVSRRRSARTSAAIA